MNTVGEPCEGKPHARIDEGRLGRHPLNQSPTPPVRMTPVEIPRVCRDADDDQILAIAVVGAVDALVTGVGDLLAIGSHRSVNIISVADFEVLARG